MTKKIRLPRKLTTEIEKRQARKIGARKATFLGRPDGVIAARESYVYVTDALGNTQEVFNRVIPVHKFGFGVPVWIVKSAGGKWELEGLKAVYDDLIDPGVLEHAAAAHGAYGYDPDWVWPEAFMPWLAAPIGKTVKIYRMPYYTGSAWIAGSAEIVDLTSHIPASGARYILLDITAAGTAQVTNGALKGSREALLLADIPALNADCKPLCAVRLYANMSAIQKGATNSDFVDLRFGQALANFVPLTRVITATAPLLIGGGASADLSVDRVIAIQAATAAIPGSMSAADKGKLDKIGDGITAGKVLTLTATDNFNLTVPATGQAAVHTSPTVAGYIPYFSGTTGILTSESTFSFLSPGSIGIGTAASAVVGVFANRTTTLDTGGLYSGNFTIYSNPAGASNASVVGFYGLAGILGAQNHATLIGSQGVVWHRGSGTLTLAEGGNSRVDNTGGGTITTVYGHLIASPVQSGAGSAITNNYGLYVQAMTVGGTLNYALYSNAGLVHFGDSVDLSSGKNITLIAGNIATDTTTGTKIGTATNQKIGFFNVAPVIQPTAYTQTYATAAKTLTQGTMTDPAAYGAGANGYSTAAQASAIHAEVIALAANMVTTQKVLNQVIDDLQALGLLS